MAEIKSTLRVYNEADVKGWRGSERQGMKVLLGDDASPSERIRVTLASFEPGMTTPLHWFLIEAFLYVISGRAVVRDIEGKTFDAGPGTVIYSPPGIAGAFEWDFKEPTQVISIRGSVDIFTTRMQFNVDKATMDSNVSATYLIERGGAKLKSFYSTPNDEEL